VTYRGIQGETYM